MRPTLFEFAGGEPAFLALATAHHARCLQDPELNHPFSHPEQHPQHVERLAAYWAEVMGGPPRYSQTCGGHSGVLQMHAGNGDMGDLGRRFVDCFVRAADDAGLPGDREFRAALRAYIQWAVEEVLSYSSLDTAVPAGMAMPRWSWMACRLQRHRRDPVRWATGVSSRFLGRRVAVSVTGRGQRATARVTSSEAATVTAVTATTDGHAPMRFASGCEPPIAAT